MGLVNCSRLGYPGKVGVFRLSFLHNNRKWSSVISKVFKRMDANEFRELGRATVDYIAEYIERIRERPVLPNVEPGYLSHQLPKEAPQLPESWRLILPDFEKYIMPGVRSRVSHGAVWENPKRSWTWLVKRRVSSNSLGINPGTPMTHWQSPKFNAYFPTGSSFPSIIGEMLSSALACIGFSWKSSPACTELELIVLDWLAKMLGLPNIFLNEDKGYGGGVIQGSASEATYLALLVAKKRVLSQMKMENPNLDEHLISSRLVAYTSDQSNSSVEKSGILASVRMRLLQTDSEAKLRGSTLLRAFEEDKISGLIPFYVVATIGTTGTCSSDPLDELGPICQNEGVWMHVDAAYAGNACICPEYRPILNGVQYADSFCVNPHKWLLVNFDCSAMWVKDTRLLEDAFNVDRIYLKYDREGENNFPPDLRHQQIPLGRRFRALKLWITLRTYGVEGLRHHIRHHCSLARKFESLVVQDNRFEIVYPTKMGLVCFKLKGDKRLSEKLLELITTDRILYMVAGSTHGKYFIRYVICSRLMTEADVLSAWAEITLRADQILKKNSKEFST